MSEPTDDFRREILMLGIISHRQQDSVWSIAKRCAATNGVPLGLAIGAASSQGGTVLVPGVVTISAGLAGFLTGLLAGTAMCTAANLAYRDELQELLD